MNCANKSRSPKIDLKPVSFVSRGMSHILISPCQLYFNTIVLFYQMTSLTRHGKFCCGGMSFLFKSYKCINIVFTMLANAVTVTANFVYTGGNNVNPPAPPTQPTSSPIYTPAPTFCWILP